MNFQNNMIECGRLTYQLHQYLKDLIKPGITTLSLDEAAKKWAEDHNCILENYGYKGYPASICVNVNEEIQHSIPGTRRIQEGDLVNIDFTIRYNGVCTDSARTYPVGKVENRYLKLISYTEKAFKNACKVLKPGVTNIQLTRQIEKIANEHHYYPADNLTGHGIGEQMHIEPYIANSTLLEVPEAILEEGKAYAIEPIFLCRRSKQTILHDGWTIISTEGVYSAQYEDTVLLVDGGYINLTNGSIKEEN